MLLDDHFAPTKVANCDSARPRLLVVAPLVPGPPWDGMRLRVLQGTRALASFADITLLAFTTSDQDTARSCDFVSQEFGAAALITERAPYPSLLGRLVRGLMSLQPAVQFGLWSADFAAKLRALASSGEFDAAVILGGNVLLAYQQYCQPLPLLMDICDNHALFYRRLASIERNPVKRVYLLAQASLSVMSMKRKAVLAAGLVFISAEDVRTSSLPNSVRTVTIPNCINSSLLTATKQSCVTSRVTLLFVGAMGSYNNRHAVRWFVEEVLPLVRIRCADAHLRVVGTACDQLGFTGSRPDVNVVGYVDDLASEYRSCDLFVCPLRSGTGIKNKLLEAMAAGCAIVTTSIGAEGVPCRNGYDLIIEDSPCGFVDAILRLVSNRHLRLELGANARRTVAANFSEDAVRAGWRSLVMSLGRSKNQNLTAQR
jgi:hypothetical protein